MKRRLFTILSALSLLLCVAVCVLWVRSYGSTDSFGRSRIYTEGTRHPFVVKQISGMVSRQGTVIFIDSEDRALKAYEMIDGPRRANLSAGWGRIDDAIVVGMLSDLESRVRHHGFSGDVLSYHSGSVSLPSTRIAFVGIPYWFLALLTATLPSIALARSIRRKRGRQRAAAGLCPSCGYDLRATLGRCPECGLVPAAPTTAP